MSKNTVLYVILTLFCCCFDVVCRLTEEERKIFTDALDESAKKVAKETKETASTIMAEIKKEYAGQDALTNLQEIKILDSQLDAWKKKVEEDITKEFKDPFEGVREKARFTELFQKYRSAILDSKDQDPREINLQLTTIVPWNKKIIWSHDRTRLLVTSWMPTWAADKYFKPKVGKEMQSPARQNDKEPVYFWVVPVPQVKDFAKEYLKSNKPESLTDRMRQYLGLPPAIDKRAFVEMWVKPEDLFRPCADDEILDSQCVLDLPKKLTPPEYHDIFNFVSTSPEHKKFYTTKKFETYTTVPFPWTRLGYTYDWGDDNKNHVGASEFAVKPAKTVKIRAIFDTDEYPKTPTILSGSE